MIAACAMQCLNAHRVRITCMQCPYAMPLMPYGRSAGLLQKRIQAKISGDKSGQRFIIGRNALAELAYVVTFDSNGDEYENGKCEISVAGNQATDLDVHSKNISSLVGIEHFKNLTLLNCRNNNIRELDLSNTKIDVKYVSYGNKTIIDGNPYEILILNSNSNTLSLQANDPYNKDILGLTGADGTSPTTLKIIGPGLQFAYLAGNTSLKSINLYNCPNIPGTMYCSFTGLSNCTVYLNQKTQINSPVDGVEFKYENPEQ